MCIIEKDKHHTFKKSLHVVRMVQVVRIYERRIEGVGTLEADRSSTLRMEKYVHCEKSTLVIFNCLLIKLYLFFYYLKIKREKAYSYSNQTL